MVGSIVSTLGVEKVDGGRIQDEKGGCVKSGRKSDGD